MYLDFKQNNRGKYKGTKKYSKEVGTGITLDYDENFKLIGADIDESENHSLEWAIHAYFGDQYFTEKVSGLMEFVKEEKMYMQEVKSGIAEIDKKRAERGIDTAAKLKEMEKRIKHWLVTEGNPQVVSELADAYVEIHTLLYDVFEFSCGIRPNG